MPYISSPDDGTQIWYELVDELKEAENGGGGTEASPSSSSSSQGGGGTTSSSSSSGDEGASAAAKPATFRRKRPRLVFIMGMGATSGCWGPQVDALAKSGVRAQALLLDNRGVGKSGSPRSKKSYSTQTMARDVLACMDAVGWKSAHLVGHSMGGMIAVKLASAAPTRVQSLTIISATAGGLQIVPTAPRAIAYTLQLFFARSPAARAAVDLKLHFAPSTLDAHDATGGATRRELLHEEYVEGAKGGGAVGQSRQGFLGQLRAVWAHRVTRGDVALVRRSPFPVLVLHGRSDLLAPPKRGAALAARLGGAYVELEGAHFLTRERGPEVNALVRSVVGGDLAGSSTTASGASTSSSSSGLPSHASVDSDDANYCGGWAVPDPHRDLVPKQGWWRHRVLRGSMTRLSSALTGAGGSMAALAAQASAAASAAAAAAANANANEREASSSLLSSALSTPLVIDDATTDAAAAAASSPARASSPAPRLAPPPYAPPTTSVIDVVQGGELRYGSSSPEPWSRETSFDDAHGCVGGLGGGGGVVEWISPPGDGSSGSLGSGSGSDDNSRGSSPAVVLKGAAMVSPAGSPPPRHRRHNQHLSFMTKRCSTADAGTPPPVSSLMTRSVAAPAAAATATAATATSAATSSSSLFKNRRSPSPSAEPPRTPPHASRGGAGGGGGGGAATAAAGANSINSNGGSFAFKRGSNLRRDLSSSNEDLRGGSSEEEDERRHGSQCPFVDPVARGIGAIVDSSYDADE